VQKAEACLTILVISISHERPPTQTNTHLLASWLLHTRTCNQRMMIDGSAKTAMAPRGFSSVATRVFHEEFSDRPASEFQDVERTLSTACPLSRRILAIRTPAEDGAWSARKANAGHQDHDRL
jgi:hypothetical protein